MAGRLYPPHCQRKNSNSEVVIEDLRRAALFCQPANNPLAHRPYRVGWLSPKGYLQPLSRNVMLHARNAPSR
jgi:hypothetical protein